ncbi:MAG: PQQ-binding-like beta-propeller repeat protein [Pirellulaceae bacterium]
MLSRIRVVAIVLAAVASLLPASASAQFGSRVLSQVNNVFLPAPREIRRQVAEAERAIAEENYSDAVEALGAILADTTTEDYFLEATAEEGTKTSLKAEAQRLLGTMPPRGRRQYEDRFGAEARRMYQDAVVSGDLRTLADITRMYFHTDAGHAATMLLGRYRLDEGRPLAAAMCFKRLADSSAAGGFEPQLSILLAQCWQMTGQTKAAQRVLTDLKERLPNARLRIGDREVGLFDDDSEALVWLAKMVPTELEGHQADAAQWLVYRGDPARNASSKGAMPISNLRWRVWTVNDHADEKRAREIYKQYRDRDVPALPAFQPLAVRNLVLMRTPERMMAVDFTTGKRVWEYPWYESQLEAGGSQTVGASGSLVDDKLNQRLFEDAIYGQIASDGQSAYVLDKLPFARANRTSGRVILMPGGGVQRQDNSDSNELVALDLKSQGKLRWIVGGESGGDEPKLAGAFFLGPPLPILGQLYVLAEFNGEIRLVVLDARSGELDWAQQLALLEGQNVLYDPTRRLAGATPSFADGVLICPTSAGAVVAVDVANRSLLWGHQYKQDTIDPRFRRVPSIRQRAVGDRWSDATATISAGRVILTPVESNEMLCLDLLTGRSLWESNVARDDKLFVAGVHDDLAIVVAKDSVRAINLGTSKEQWKTTLDGAPSGRGFISDGFYYQPTTASTIYKINLDDGAVPSGQDSENPARTDGILGNLVCYKDEVISQGFDNEMNPQLTVYYQHDALRGKVKQALQTNPHDSWALARQGELLQGDGRLIEAIEAFREAYRYDDSEEHRALLVEAIIAALTSDFPKHRQLVEESERLTRNTSWRADFLRAAAQGRQRAGELEAALRDYLELIALASVELGEESTEAALEQPEPGWQVRRQRWVRARLQELLQASQSDHQQGVDALVAEKFEAAMSARDVAELQRFVDYFPKHALASRARLALAQRLIGGEQQLEAELVLAGLRRGDVADAAAATALYCRLLEHTGPVWEAAQAYRDLARNWGDVVCLAGRTGRQLAAAVDPHSPAGELLANVSRWNRGDAEVSASAYAGQQNNTYQRIYPVNIPQWDLGSGDRMRVRIDQQRQELILCRADGTELARVSSARDDKINAFPNYSLVHAKGIGHLLVVSLGFEIVAVDVAEAQNDPANAVVWRFNLASIAAGGRSGIPLINATSRINPWGDTYYLPTDPLRRPFGQIASLSEAGVCFQFGQRLICLDPLTGQEIWSRNGFPEGCDVFGDERFVFAIPPNGSSAAVYSTSDGSLLGSRTLNDEQHRWATHGRNLLAWSEQGESLELQLIDLWTGDVLFKRSYAQGTKASIVDHHEVAVYETDGRFTMFRLQDGKERFSITLAAEPRLASIYVQRRAEQYLLMTNRPVTSPLPDTNVQGAPGGFYAPLVNGSLYAIESDSGKPRWSAPVAVEQYGLPLDQPTDTPLFVFLRHLNSTAPGAARPTRTSVLGIDVRDGGVILSDESPAMTSSYSIVGDVENQSVKLSLTGRSYTLQFAKKKATPPASAGG